MKETLKEKKLQSIKIKLLIEKLETISGLKVELNEVRRKPVATISEVITVIKNLIKKNKLQNTIKIFKNSNVVRLEDIKGKADSFSIKSIGYGLKEEGFRESKEKIVNEKSYQQYIDATKRFIVLLPN